MNWRIYPIAACCFVLSACAGSFSSDLKHWDVVSNGKLSKRHGEWANCITSSIGNGGSFAEVLSRCDQKKSVYWSSLSYEEERRLINAAWFAYKSEEYDREAAMDEAII
jgi:hypothetical protein